jgi:hypothetical protein
MLLPSRARFLIITCQIIPFLTPSFFAYFFYFPYGSEYFIDLFIPCLETMIFHVHVGGKGKGVNNLGLKEEGY